MSSLHHLLELQQFRALRLLAVVLKDKRRWHLPPGPKGLPFVGSLFDLADSGLVRARERAWHQQYGDIFYTKVGATDYIWLSSPKVVKDLLDKRSSKYSSRSPAPFAQDVGSGGKRQLFMAYGPEWRSLRKASHSLLNLQSAVGYQPVQDYESKQLMVDLLNDPKNFYEHNRRYSSSVIMYVAYGYRLPSWQHPLVKQIYSVLDNLTEMTAPGAHAVDSFPSLANLPQWMLGNWRSKAEKVFKHDSKVYMDLWAKLKKKTDEGTANDCFFKDFYLSKTKEHNIDELLAAYTCGGLVKAGSETTATTLNNFILAMVLYPEAAKKAQEEIDRVVGSNRMPTWDDEKDLHYVRALVKETLRWRPVNKFGMPHYTTEDDWYEGYFIPKNSVIMLNWWAIHFDPKLHADAETFDPSRYLNKPHSAAEYLNANDPYERDHFTYSAGRRVALGFNVSKNLDEQNQVVKPEVEMVRGFLSVPRHFEASLIPRSSAHIAVIRKDFEEAPKLGV